MARPYGAQTGEQGMAHALGTASGDNFPWILQFPGPTLEHPVFAGKPVVCLFIYLALPVTSKERFPCPYANSSPAE